MRNLFTVLIAVLSFAACSDSGPELVTPDYTASDNPNFVSLEEALKAADYHFALVFGDETRSDKRKVTNVETFRPYGATRSLDDSGMYGFYIVNYANNGGFAMISADNRRDPIYAISDEGSLHLTDTLGNEGLSYYFNTMLPEMERAETAGITLPNPNPINPIDTTISPWVHPWISVRTVISEPMLTGLLNQLHQGHPYNRLCFTNDNEQSVVGCTALATGTVIAYNKWPSSYQSFYFDWDTMLSNSYDYSWPNLFKFIGSNGNLDTKYYGNSAEASPSLIPRTFKNFGYKNATFKNGFDINIVDNELKQKQPVICSGYYNDDNGINGHSWIIDGGYYTKNPNILDNGQTYNYTYYYRCVWGQDPNKDNGYFKYGQFKMGSYPVYQDLNIVYGYRPNK